MKPIYSQLAGALALTVLAAACTQAPKPAPTPVASASPSSPARPAPQSPTPPASTSWIDAPQTPGTWRLQTGSGSTVATFGDSASEPRFALRCVQANRQVTIERAGEASAPVPLVIRTRTRSATLTAQPVGGAMPLLTANLQNTDPLLDAMAINRGRFAVEVAGLPTLYLPAWAEVTRVIEDCR